MKLHLLTDVQRGDIQLKKGETFEVEEVVIDAYKIKVPMKQKGKFRYALIKDDEGILVE